MSCATPIGANRSASGSSNQRPPHRAPALARRRSEEGDTLYVYVAVFALVSVVLVSAPERGGVLFVYEAYIPCIMFMYYSTKELRWQGNPRVSQPALNQVWLSFAFLKLADLQVRSTL